MQHITLEDFSVAIVTCGICFQQQKDQWIIRAQQEGDIPIIDRRYPQNADSRNRPMVSRDSFREGPLLQQNGGTDFREGLPPPQNGEISFRDVQPPRENNQGQIVRPPPEPVNTNLYVPPEGGRQVGDRKGYLTSLCRGRVPMGIPLGCGQIICGVLVTANTIFLLIYHAPSTFAKNHCETNRMQK